ncbi:hypothetical protein M404DRAFT_842832 [Pisolithus tinctorius Marx 270]|uniref:F-box domain-containing protein n=1 Tax=Pisolithus tinctorius Marx 270 TaxID=870435 RepID=A0A0C3PQU1_PISTI|nr:hypothetical protein M404DRAFT_842832 [Pisolithus tinctorius Marx 270]
MMMSLCIEQQPSRLPLETWHQILSFLNIATIHNLMLSCKTHYEKGRRYLQYHRLLLAQNFFENPQDLYDLLRLGQAIISGSTALHFLLAQKEVTWSPHDLDVYTIPKNIEFLLTEVKLRGYQIISVKTGNDVRYYNSHIASIFTLVRNRRKIDIMVSASPTPISPIFQYHSTVLMNFITHDTVFCAYPHLTFQRQSLVNPFVIFAQALKRSMMEALVKYHDRGIKYLKCSEDHKHLPCHKNDFRSIHDPDCMWMQLFPSPPSISSREHRKTEIAVTNLEWSLGGYVCHKTPPFVPSSIRIS